MYFISNGGLGAMDSAPVLRGLTHALPDSGFAPPSGTVFDAWEIGGERYAPGDVYTVCADTDVTALWKNVYTVTWANHDGTVLRTDKVPQGDVPVYSGAEPVKRADAEYFHSFAGWSPAVAAVNGDATYTAKFTDEPRSYTVTWKDWDGTVLETDAYLPFGTVPGYDGDTPTRFDDNDTVIFRFDGWSPGIAPVQGDTVYTARYGETRIERTEPYAQQFPAELNAPAGGKMLISPVNASMGRTITLTAEQLEGWKLAELTVRRRNGARSAVRLTDEGGGTFTFAMPDGKVDIELLFEPVDLLTMFPDLRPNAWYLDAVRWAVSHGVMRGTGRGFEPDAAASCAMVAQMLFNMDRGSAPAAEGTNSGRWYDECMAWLEENGLTEGIDGSIEPNGVITREQVTVLLYNYAKYKGFELGEEAALDAFADAGSVSPGAEEAMRRAVGSGLVKGMGDGTLDPGGGAARAQIAALMQRFCGMITE